MNSIGPVGEEVRRALLDFFVELRAGLERV
jgi:hypothetical protein